MTSPGETLYWGNPFPGLRAFEEEDEAIFFGRESQVRELVDRMDSERLIAVVGLSGSGKSSLVRAGLIPALRRGKLSGTGVRWRIAVLRPGADPLGNVAAALNQRGVLGPSEGRESTLRASAFGLLHAGREGRKPDQNLLVVVDQFEEIFRLRSDHSRGWGEAVDFVSLLLTASRDFRPDYRTWIILTMRSDYIGDCAQFRGLPEALNRGQYLVPRLADDEWRRAIRKPAELAGTPLDEQLVQQLMADAGDLPDQLPVLQHLLMRMWEQRAGARITLREYQAAGGWNGGLDQHLEEILARFTEEQQQTARRIWQRLTEIGERNRDSRRPARVADLMAVTGRSLADVAAVIDPFRADGCHFLVSSDAVLSEASVVDIAHESLIRRWRKLAGWAKQEAEWAGAWREVEAAAFSRVPEPWSGAKLARAVQDRKEGEWTEPWALRYARGTTLEERQSSYRKTIRFLDESGNAELRRLRRERLVFRAMVLACLVFLTVAAFAAYSWRKADRATREANRQEEIARDAEKTAQRERDTARKAEKATTEALNAKVEALSQAEENRRSADAAAQAAKEAASLATARLLTNDAGYPGRSLLQHQMLLAAESLRTAWTEAGYSVWHAAARKLPPVLGDIETHSGALDLAFTPDGRHLVVLCGPDLHVYSVLDLQDHRNAEGLAGGKRVAISPGGDRAAVYRSGITQLIDLRTLSSPLLVRVDGRALGSAEEVAFHPGGKTLAAVTDEQVVIADAATGNGRSTLKLPAARVGTDLSFDGSAVLVHGEQSMAVHNTSDGSVRWTIPWSKPGRLARFSGDGRHVICLFPGETILDAVTGKTVVDNPSADSFVPEGRAAAALRDTLTATGADVYAARDKVRRIGGESRESQLLPGDLWFTDSLRPLAVSPSGRKLAVLISRGWSIIDVVLGRPLEPLHVQLGSDYDPNSSRPAFTADDRFASVSMTGDREDGIRPRLQILDLRSLPWPSQTPFGYGGLAVSPVANLVLAEGNPGQPYRAYDLAGRPRSVKFQARGSLVLSRTGRYLAHSDAAGRTRWDIEDLVTGRHVEIPGAGYPTFAPDEKVVLVSSNVFSLENPSSPQPIVAGKRISVVAAPNSDLVIVRQLGEDFRVRGNPEIFSWSKRRIVGPAPPGSSHTPGPGGRIAVWNEKARALEIWSLGGKLPIASTLEPRLSGAPGVRFSPDGKLLLADDLVFDAATLRVILRADLGRARIAGFTSDNRFLVSWQSRHDGFPVPTYIPLTMEGVLAETCGKASRPLTVDEWRDRSPGSPPHATCPDRLVRLPANR